MAAGSQQPAPPEVDPSAFRALFESAPGLYLVLQPDAPRYTIVAVSDAYEVAGASNGAEALDRLRDGSALPSLILLDLMMPVMDGRTFCLKQQHDVALAHIPVVLLSANGDLTREASELGVAGFLAKPLTLDSLLQAVENHRPRH